MSDNNETIPESIQAITEAFSTISDSITLFKMQLSTLQQQVKTVEKQVKKELKGLKKKTNPNDKPKGKQAPSGFAKPSKVTKELCEFMNKPEGSEIARTEVTQALVSYIKENNLIGNSDNKKNKIIPDEKLKNLLGLQDDDLNELNYFSIQKYMNKHFQSKKETTIDT